MTQQFRALVEHSEDPGLLLSTQHADSKLSIIPVPEDPVPFSGLLAHEDGVHRHTCRWGSQTHRQVGFTDTQVGKTLLCRKKCSK